VSSFEEAYPDKVLAWCAYTAAWWQPLRLQNITLRHRACGKLDDNDSSKPLNISNKVDD